MKLAQHPDSKQSLPASNTAPDKAICPYCGGLVTLRRRKRMNGSLAYFWRHQDNRDRSCNGRSRPIQQ